MRVKEQKNLAQEKLSSSSSKRYSSPLRDYISYRALTLHKKKKKNHSGGISTQLLNSRVFVDNFTKQENFAFLDNNDF